MVTLEKSLILKEHFYELCISSIQILVVVYHIFLKSCTGHLFQKLLFLHQLTQNMRTDLFSDLLKLTQIVFESGDQIPAPDDRFVFCPFSFHKKNLIL